MSTATTSLPLATDALASATSSPSSAAADCSPAFCVCFPGQPRLLPCRCGCGDQGFCGVGEQHRIKDALADVARLRDLRDWGYEQDARWYEKLFISWLETDWMPEGAKAIYRQAIIVPRLPNQAKEAA